MNWIEGRASGASIHFLRCDGGSVGTEWCMQGVENFSLFITVRIC